MTAVTDSNSLFCELPHFHAVQYVSETWPLLATILLGTVFVALSWQFLQLYAQVVKLTAFKVLQCTKQHETVIDFSDSIYIYIKCLACLSVCTLITTGTGMAIVSKFSGQLQGAPGWFSMQKIGSKNLGGTRQAEWLVVICPYVIYIIF